MLEQVFSAVGSFVSRVAVAAVKDPSSVLRIVTAVTKAVEAEDLAASAKAIEEAAYKESWRHGFKPTQA